MTSPMWRTGVSGPSGPGPAQVAEERLAAAEARVEELIEQVAVLSRMLFGQSSEKTGARAVPPDPAWCRRAGESAVRTMAESERARRGQRPGGTGHGRRDYPHLDTREEIHDVPDGQRVCPGCGRAFEPLGSEGSEQIDWQVQHHPDRAPAAALPAALAPARGRGR